MEKILFGAFTALLAWAVISIGGCNNGIVALEDYEHGVAFCEQKFSHVVHIDDASVWNDGKATYVVNKGHHEDPEVKELIELAHYECGLLYGE